MDRLFEQISDDLERIRRERPLIHHITNMVVMNETANATLCLGALPVMAHAIEEVQEMVQVAGALVLNIGTLTNELVESMVVAGKRANDLGIPVVLDPVGAGATRMRTDAALCLMSEVKPDILRGNGAEISVLAGAGGQVRGVESISQASDLKQVASELAAARGCTVAITGRRDIVSDGKRTAVIENGHELLSRVTGTGCMATTSVAAFAAVEKDLFAAAVGGLVTIGIAGEKAAEVSGNGPGTFHVALYDSLAAVSKEDILRLAKVRLAD